MGRRLVTFWLINRSVGWCLCAGADIDLYFYFWVNLVLVWPLGFYYGMPVDTCTTWSVTFGSGVSLLLICSFNAWGFLHGIKFEWEVEDGWPGVECRYASDRSFGVTAALTITVEHESEGCKLLVKALFDVSRDQRISQDSKKYWSM